MHVVDSVVTAKSIEHQQVAINCKGCVCEVYRYTSCDVLSGWHTTEKTEDLARGDMSGRCELARRLFHVGQA